jgi:hypothetical protein
MMIAVDDASGIAIALSRGWQHHKRCCEGCGTAPCWSACRPSGRADLLGFGRIEHLGRRWLPSSACLGIRGGEQVPWPSSLAGGPYGWAQLATFVITGLLIVVLAVALRDQLPRRRARSFAVVLLAPVGGGAAARRVQGRYADAQRRESQDLERVGARDRVLVDHCGRVVAPLTMALAVGGDAAGCRPIAVVSLAASALFVVSCSCPG